VIHCGKVPSAKWRNWQTHQTQNLALFTQRVGSTPTFATKYLGAPSNDGL
jgi:hypothetical protein